MNLVLESPYIQTHQGIYISKTHHKPKYELSLFILTIPYCWLSHNSPNIAYFLESHLSHIHISVWMGPYDIFKCKLFDILLLIDFDMFQDGQLIFRDMVNI